MTIQNSTKPTKPPRTARHLDVVAIDPGEPSQALTAPIDLFGIGAIAIIAALCAWILISMAWGTPSERSQREIDRLHQELLATQEKLQSIEACIDQN